MATNSAATGATGPAGPAITVTFDSTQAKNYIAGQIIYSGGTLYIALKNAPAGTPGVGVNDYALLSGFSATGPTGAHGAADIITYTTGAASGYTEGELVQLNGIIYVVDSNPALGGVTGTPGVSGSTGYVPLSSYGVTGATGATGVTGAMGYGEIVAFDPANFADYVIDQVISYNGKYYRVTTAPVTAADTPDANTDYTELSTYGASGATGATGAVGKLGYPGLGSMLTFDSGSVSVGAALSVPLPLVSAVDDALRTNVIIGDKFWGPEVGSELGQIEIKLSSAGLPPYPLKVGKSGYIYEWYAAFDAVVSANLAFPAELRAQLIHAPAVPAGTPLSDLEWDLIDEISLGTLQLLAVANRYSGGGLLPAPPQTRINRGDYLMVRFYLNTTIATAITGFHATATVSMS